MLEHVFNTTVLTIRDVLPIVAILVGFQVLVLRRRVPNLARTLIGFVYVLAGLALFLVGLEQALFPLGKLMARQLTDPAFVLGEAISADTVIHWWNYGWVYAFAAAIGFATTNPKGEFPRIRVRARSRRSRPGTASHSSDSGGEDPLPRPGHNPRHVVQE